MFNYQGILNHGHYGQRIGMVREVRAWMVGGSQCVL